jgi:hypothetical protein
MSLPASDLPASNNRTFPMVVAAVLGVLGLALALYLSA